MLIVGLEGLWGGIVCSVVLFIVYWIPEPPIGENTIDSFLMIGNDGALGRIRQPPVGNRLPRVVAGKETAVRPQRRVERL